MAANVKNLPLSVIFAAKSGDGQALGAVLNHYQRYIRSLATRTLTDECGNQADTWAVLCIFKANKNRTIISGFFILVKIKGK